MKKHNSDFDQELRSALEHLDEATTKATPSPQWFEQFVVEQQRVMQRRFRRDVLLFLLTAFIVVAGMLISFTYGLGALVLFQAVVTLCITLPLALRRKERTDAS